MRTFLFLLLFILISLTAEGLSTGDSAVLVSDTSGLARADSLSPGQEYGLEAGNEPADTTRPKFIKLKAVVLALALGHFGVHRIYLGTHARVPVVYSLTLGGGLGVLPLIDAIAIIFTEDLSKFKDNPRVFMWVK